MALRRTRDPHSRPCPRQAGFSYLEGLIALSIVALTMAIAMTFFGSLGSTLRTESTTLATQQTGRLVLDELSRTTRQAGYGIARADPFNAAAWQAAIIHASPNTLAFNADIDRTIGSLSTGVTLSFPTGPSYTGEGSASSQAGSETYVYTLDANGDGALTAADRTEAAAASFNPAADTDNPLDFALSRRIYGYNGSDQGGDLEPLAANLFSNATADAVYPDGTTPDSLFIYWLTEDLNEDGALDKAECVNDVVASCPPSSPRNPLLYLWGDDNFDGRLSETEKAALATLEVGSAAWSKNPLVGGGSYVSTILAAAADPGSSDPYTLKVVDADPFAPGTHVVLGSGGSAERHYVDAVVRTAPELLVFSAPVANLHAAGTSVTALPSTMLRAIRSVGITFSAITGQRDSDGGARAIGRAGRVGTRGLDYRVMPFRREVEVINAPAVALVKSTPPGAVDVCPLLVENACSGTGLEWTTRFVNLAGQNEFVFRVIDELGTPVQGIAVQLSNADASLGSPAADTLTTDASGLVSVTYNMTGALGTDEIDAVVSCVSDAGVIESDAATARVSLYEIDTELTRDCASTVSPNEPDPEVPFQITLSSVDGPVSGEDIELSLDFDPLFLPVTPDFTSLVGDLEVEGLPVGTTNSSGLLDPLTFATDSGGAVRGFAGLAADVSGKGARLQLTTGIPADGCRTVPDSTAVGAMFFDLAHDSVSPNPGCTAGSPCTITAGMSAPIVAATLKINDQPVPGAPLDFTANDVQVPSDGIETGTSIVKPTSGVTTDAGGRGQIKVSNNGASVITPVTPLVTRVDVSSPGPPAWCTSGPIRGSSPSSEFRFEAPAPQCDATMQQSWLSEIDNKKICAHARNENEVDGCDQYLKGIRITVYEPDGVTPVAGLRIKKIEGGAVTSSPSCSTSGQVRLFEDKCHAEDRLLNNGESWFFTTFESCDPPMTPVTAQDHFTFGKIEFENNYPPGAEMDVTLIFVCDGECDPDFVESDTFRMTLPL